MTSPLTIALAGNPNAGKTSIFNFLTGAHQTVGNYPGVTVSKREGTLIHKKQKITVVDLPGTYSLTAYTPEELVTRNYLTTERPTVVSVIDSNSLERNLYLCIQFLELGVPMVLALNMMDEVRRHGIKIDVNKLSERIGLPIVETVGRTGEGRQQLIDEAVKFSKEHPSDWVAPQISYGKELNEILNDMGEEIGKFPDITSRFPARWIALKYLEKDEHIFSLCQKEEGLHNHLMHFVVQAEIVSEERHRCSPEAVITDFRYRFIHKLLGHDIITYPASTDEQTFTDSLDRVLTQPFFGPLLMLGIFYAMFWLTFSLGEYPMNWLESFFGWMGSTATVIIPKGYLQSLVVSGIIDGVGGVLSFVPLIMIMFIQISFLEDSGYMARMAYMLDRVLRIFGLHGASVMPFIISGGIPGGCAVPGVMAARTLKSPKEKLATILTVPLLACGAKVPVLILLAAAFFKGSAASALFLTTLVGWIAVLLVAKLLRSTVIKGEATPFVMELPPYRLPTIKGILIHTWERAYQYIKKAGTVILAISILLWGAMTFPNIDKIDSDRFEMERLKVNQILEQESNTQEREILIDKIRGIDNSEAQLRLKNSLAGKVGIFIEPVSRLAGFDWRSNIALLGGIAAKEVIVSTLGTSYSLGEVDPEETQGLSNRLRKDPGFSGLTAIALMVFVMLYSPCFVTVVAIAKESSWNWAIFSIFFNTLMAFGVAVAVYQVGTTLAA
ncbi:MAG: ferrous iron transport protein B [Proteobacteria bacterium]|nr:ferrous iron transport protein B [Pseudomonadota bacterium]